MYIYVCLLLCMLDFVLGYEVSVQQKEGSRTGDLLVGEIVIVEGIPGATNSNCERENHTTEVPGFFDSTRRTVPLLLCAGS